MTTLPYLYIDRTIMQASLAARNRVYRDRITSVDAEHVRVIENLIDRLIVVVMHANAHHKGNISMLIDRQSFARLLSTCTPLAVQELNDEIYVAAKQAEYHRANVIHKLMVHSKGDVLFTIVPHGSEHAVHLESESGQKYFCAHMSWNNKIKTTLFPGTATQSEKVNESMNTTITDLAQHTEFDAIAINRALSSNADYCAALAHATQSITHMFEHNLDHLVRVVTCTNLMHDKHTGLVLDMYSFAHYVKCPVAMIRGNAPDLFVAAIRTAYRFRAFIENIKVDLNNPKAMLHIEPRQSTSYVSMYRGNVVPYFGLSANVSLVETLIRAQDNWKAWTESSQEPKRTLREIEAERAMAKPLAEPVRSERRFVEGKGPVQQPTVVSPSRKKPYTRRKEKAQLPTSGGEVSVPTTVLQSRNTTHPVPGGCVQAMLGQRHVPSQATFSEAKANLMAELDAASTAQQPFNVHPGVANFRQQPIRAYGESEVRPTALPAMNPLSGKHTNPYSNVTDQNVKGHEEPWLHVIDSVNRDPLYGLDGAGRAFSINDFICHMQ